MTHLTGFACPPARRASRSGAEYRKRSATPRAGKQTRSNESLSTLLGIKDIGPRVDADAVEALAQRRIKEIGLTERRFADLWRIKYGVDVDFRRLLALARLSVDRELSGKPKTSDQERLRHAVSHSVAKLNADMVEIDRKILVLRRGLKARRGRSRAARATPKDIKRDIKHLKAVRDTIEKKVLPDLSTKQSQLDHLCHSGDASIEAINKKTEATLKAADSALTDHAGALNRQGVPSVFVISPATDETPLSEADPQVGGDDLRAASYSTLFSSLKDDDDGVLAAKLDPKDTVAKRLEAAAKGRHWLWTPMMAGDDGIYRSEPMEPLSELENSKAKRFFIQDAWPEEMYRHTVQETYLHIVKNGLPKQGRRFLEHHATLRKNIDKVEEALKDEKHPSGKVLRTAKASAERLKVYFKETKEQDLIEEDRVFLGRLDAVIRHSDVLLRWAAKTTADNTPVRPA